MKSAIILCSGGLDSVTLAHYIRKKLSYNKIYILFFNYGQRSLVQERKYSKLCARDLKAKFIELSLPSTLINCSKIHSTEKPKKVKIIDLKDTNKESANWYVPARNLLFLSHALSLGESININNSEQIDLFIGFKNEGSESYPDTTYEFLRRFNSISTKSTISKIKTKAPLIKKDKEEIINLGKKMGVDFSKTYTCYIGGKNHCGICLSCRLRQEGFYWANTLDPTRYKNKMPDFRLSKD